MDPTYYNGHIVKFPTKQICRQLFNHSWFTLIATYSIATSFIYMACCTTNNHNRWPFTPTIRPSFGLLQFRDQIIYHIGRCGFRGKLTMLMVVKILHGINSELILWPIVRLSYDLPLAGRDLWQTYLCVSCNTSHSESDELNYRNRLASTSMCAVVKPDVMTAASWFSSIMLHNQPTQGSTI